MTAAQEQVEQAVFGQVVARLRKRRGLSQQVFAGRIGISQPQLSRIERGAAAPSSGLFDRMAFALDLHPDELQVLFEEALGRTRRAASRVMDRDEGAGVWATALKVAGMAGVVALAAFAVAALLEDDRD